MFVCVCVCECGCVSVRMCLAGQGWMLFSLHLDRKWWMALLLEKTEIIASIRVLHFHFHSAVFVHYSIPAHSLDVSRHSPECRSHWFDELELQRVVHHLGDCPIPVVLLSRTYCRTLHMQCKHRLRWKILSAIGPLWAVISNNFGKLNFVSKMWKWVF